MRNPDKNIPSHQNEVCTAFGYESVAAAATFLRGVNFFMRMNIPARLS